jgi:hypothetical protein
LKLKRSGYISGTTDEKKFGYTLTGNFVTSVTAVWVVVALPGLPNAVPIIALKLVITALLGFT